MYTSIFALEKFWAENKKFLILRALVKTKTIDIVKKNLDGRIY